ncbi:MAG TPA: hypothetical protein VGI81_20530 [Tepidisphaeraceae bacterium]
MAGGSGVTGCLELLEPRRMLAATSPLDPAFGVGGQVANLGGPIESLPDGKILVDVNGSGTIERLNADGSVDTTFKPAGVIDDWKPGVARQPDGKLLVISGGVLTRYDIHGSVDARFGSNGTVSAFELPYWARSFTPQDVALEGGEIIVAGIAQPTDPSTSPQAVIEQLSAGGTPSSSPYGLEFYPAPVYDNETVPRVVRMRIAKSGEVIVGVSGIYGGPGEVVAFPRPGILPPFAPFAANNLAPMDVTDLAITPSGKVLVAGTLVAGAVSPPSPPVASVERLNADLTADGSFGADYRGVATIAGTTAGSYVALASNGTVLTDATNADGSHSLFRLIPATYYTQTVSGHVFDDLNGDGIEEPGEPPLAGWRVEVSEGASAMTDAQGNFTTPAESNDGSYTITEVIKPGWACTDPANPGTGAGTQTTPFGTPQPVTGITFGDAPLRNVASVFGRIAGGGTAESNWRVYIDTNGDGQWESGEPYVWTDANGNYRFTGLNPGTYELRDDIHKGWGQLSPSTTVAATPTAEGSGLMTLTLAAGDNKRVNFVEKRVTACRISGYVFLDRNHDGIREPGEPTTQPIEAELIISGVSDITWNSTGYFAIDDLPLGTYTIYLNPAGVGTDAVATTPVYNITFRKPGIFANAVIGEYLRPGPS